MEKEGSIKWFSELGAGDIEIAGIKGAFLSEIYNKKFPVPPGFVITSNAFNLFLESTGINKKIDEIINNTNVENSKELKENSRNIRELINNTKLPDNIREEIVEAYQVLDIDKESFKGAAQSAMEILRNSHEPPFVSVRTSFVNNDFENLSFSGQHDSYLNVKGNEELIRSVKNSFASLYSNRAIYYRKKNGVTKVNTGVIIQKMIDSQKSGVVFSKDPMNASSKGNYLIEAVWGLGEGIVSGKINGDNYYVDNEFNILEKNVADKVVALTRNSSGKTEEVKLNSEISNREVLTGHELKILAGLVSRLDGHFKIPQDVEFAIDKEGIHLLQCRPITSEPKVGDSELEGNVLFTGKAVSAGVSSGTVKIVNGFEDLNNLHRGNVVVVNYPEKEMFSNIQNSVALISNLGGLSSYAATVSREMGIPAVFGAKNATNKLKDGQIVTVDGFTGRIIEGQGVEKKVKIMKIIPTEKIKLKTVIDIPDYSSMAAESGINSVGLVRLESVISRNGRHPNWYLKNDKIGEYIKLINDGLRKISQSFNDVWIRSSNFRSDEYNNLEDSPDNNELNPLLGDYGIRFGLKNRELLEAEFKAIKEIADEYENKKYGILISKIVSVNELIESKKLAEQIGIPNNVKIGVMIETPAAVQIINSLCEEGIDFVNIGINDLTQHTLAVDKNNVNVNDLYDEMNPAILNSIRYVLRRCKKYGVESSIYFDTRIFKEGDELIRFLVEEEINSITVGADKAYEVSKIISENEINDTEKTEIRKDDMGISKQEDKNEDKNFDHEEAILKALETEEEKVEDYSPSGNFETNKDKDVPVLNEAIPVGSEDLGNDSVDLDEELDMNLPDEEIENKNMEINEEEIGGKVYEDQEDIAMNVEVQREAVESEMRGEVLSKLFGKEEKKEEKDGAGEGDETLDIF